MTVALTQKQIWPDSLRLCLRRDWLNAKLDVNADAKVDIDAKGVRTRSFFQSVHKKKKKKTKKKHAAFKEDNVLQTHSVCFS